MTIAASKSKLNKTMQVLSTLSDLQLDMIYNYAQFISTQPIVEYPQSNESAEQIVNRLAGLIPDEGKSLEDYRMERLEERYGPLD